MTLFSIRPITEQDIPFLWDMLYESIYVAEGQKPVSKAILQEPSISKYVADWGRDGDIGFIAENDSGAAIGSVTIRYFKAENKGFGYINDDTPELGMAIRSAYRGKGIGTELLRMLIEHATMKGINAISLSVDPNNPAVKLYKRFGFEEIGFEGTSITMVNHLSNKH